MLLERSAAFIRLALEKSSNTGTRDPESSGGARRRAYPERTQPIRSERSRRSAWVGQSLLRLLTLTPPSDLTLYFTKCAPWRPSPSLTAAGDEQGRVHIGCGLERVRSCTHLRWSISGKQVGRRRRGIGCGRRADVMARVSCAHAAVA